MIGFHRTIADLQSRPDSGREPRRFGRSRNQPERERQRQLARENKMDKYRTERIQKEEVIFFAKTLPDEVLQESLQNPDYFGVAKLLNIEKMFNARVYMGHKIGTLNQHMKPYIYGQRLDYLVIDLVKTKKLLFEALNFAAHIAFRDGIILFVNKSPSVGFVLLQIAEFQSNFVFFLIRLVTLLSKQQRTVGSTVIVVIGVLVHLQIPQHFLKQ